MNGGWPLAGLVALAGCAVVGLQWWWMHRLYDRRLARQHQRHVQQQQTVARQLEQAKRQIEQLQHDLAAARLQLKRLSGGAASTASATQQLRAREALLRALDDATQTSAERLPPDGFADTLPSPQYPEYLALLANR